MNILVVDDSKIDLRITKPVKQSQLFDCIAGVVSADIERFLRHGDRSKETPSAHGNGALTGSIHLVLLAEDNAINKQLAVAQLKKFGIKPHVVSNGREAFEAFLKHEYAMILMDCQMPEVDGFEATRLIRKAERRTGGHVRIVAMTANALEATAILVSPPVWMIIFPSRSISQS